MHWSIEKHGKGYVLYQGRDNSHHGLNLVYMSEPDRNWETVSHLIEAAPNLFEALEELYAIVKGECPRLLDDDRGGSGYVDELCSSAISKAKGLIK